MQKQVPPVAFIVRIGLGLFKSFSFFIVLQLFSQCWDLFGDHSCMVWSLEVLLADFVWWQGLVCSRNCCQHGLLQTPERMALKHDLVWMLSASRCFSCWFGLRCARNSRFVLVAMTNSVSRHGKKHPVSMDVLGSFCSVVISVLDLSSHMPQVNCMWFPPAGLFIEFWNVVLHLSMSLQESLFLNAAVPSSLCRLHHLVFLKRDLVLSKMHAPARSASHDDSCPPMVSPFSSGSLSQSH